MKISNLHFKNRTRNRNPLPPQSTSKTLSSVFPTFVQRYRLRLSLHQPRGDGPRTRKQGVHRHRGISTEGGLDEASQILLQHLTAWHVQWYTTDFVYTYIFIIIIVIIIITIIIIIIIIIIVIIIIIIIIISINKNYSFIN